MAKKSTRKSVTDLPALLEREELPPLVTLVGPEDFLRRDALQDILHHWHGDPVPDEDVTRLAAGDRQSVTAEQLATLFDELHTPSLFGGRRSVLVENAQPFLDADPAAWLQLLEQGWSGALLVLQLSSVDGRTRLGKAIDRAGWVLEATKPFHRPPPWKPRSAAWDNPLNGWIRQRAHRAGLALDPPTAHLLQSRIGTGLADLAGVIERLATVLEGRGTITAELVEKYTPAGEDSDLFELVDVILGGDRARALAMARDLLHRGATDQRGYRVTDPASIVLQLNGTLLRRLRQLRVVHEVQGAGGGEQEILAAAGISRFLWPRFQEQARHTDPPRLARLVAAARRTDQDLKTTSGALAPELLERLALQ